MSGLQYPGFYAPPPVVVAPDVLPPVITTTSLPNPVPTVLYVASVQAIDGTPPYRFGLVSGALPPGLSLSQTGVIMGTVPVLAVIGPETLQPGVVDTPYPGAQLSVPGGASLFYPFTVRVVDVAGAYDDQDLVLTGVLWQNPTLFRATNLPACLRLMPDGVLQGTPMTVGTFSPTVQATDQNGAVVTRAYTLVVTS
jgi:large repetitive protein